MAVEPAGRRPAEAARRGREGAGSGSRQMGQFWMKRLWRQKVGNAGIPLQSMDRAARSPFQPVKVVFTPRLPHRRAASLIVKGLTPITAAALGCLTAALLAGAAPARADLASLRADANCRTHQPVDVDGKTIPGFSYRFCDDGVPAQGGTTPNVGAVRAIEVPASYRWPDPAPAGVADPTVDGLPPAAPDPACGTSAAKVPGSAPSAADPSRCVVALDVDLTLPATPPPPGGRPLILMMHGCCGGNKTGWESGSLTAPGRFDESGERWHYNNVWFAARGYVVVTYTARGFVTAAGQGSTGQTQIDSLQYEVNDAQSLIGQIVDDPALGVDPQRIVVSGGSYGGGLAWLLFTDPVWSSPGGRPVRLAAAAPRYGWSDLVYSLLPTGGHFYDQGRLPSTDGRDSGFNPPGTPADRRVPAGIPIKTIIAALFASGAAGQNHATFPQAINDAFNCTQTFWPPEQSPLCGALLDTVLPDFLRYRSAYYRNEFFARAAADPAYRIPVFSAGTHTDPLFPPIEHHRMAERLRALVPGYPIQEYFGDYQHFTQSKAREWGDICGEDRHVCRFADYPGGDLNAAPPTRRRTGVTTLLNAFIDHYARPPGNPEAPRPPFDVTASLQVCPKNATAEQPANEPGPTFTAPTYDALSPGTLTLSFAGAQTTTSKASPNPHAVNSDPLGNTAKNSSQCPVETGAAGPGVAVYDSPPLPATRTLLGGSIVTAKYVATGGSALQLNARLYDLFPDGTAVMVDRGPARLPEGVASGTARFQLHGNGWRLEPGHRIRLELAQDDDPYLKSADVPSSMSITDVTLAMPVREGGSVAAADRSAPRARMIAPALASSAGPGPRFTLRWRGSDIGTGIASFQVQARRLSGPPRARRAVTPWRNLPRLRATRRTSARFRGRPGETYEFRVRARDRAGNRGRFSSARTVVPLDDSARDVARSGPWRRLRDRRAWGGGVAACAVRGCALSLRWRGGGLSLVGATGPDGGRALVTFDGRRRVVDFYSARPARRRVLAAFRARPGPHPFRARSGPHRLRVVVLGTRRARSRGLTVRIDALGPRLRRDR